MCGAWPEFRRAFIRGEAVDNAAEFGDPLGDSNPDQKPRDFRYIFQRAWECPSPPPEPVAGEYVDVEAPEEIPADLLPVCSCVAFEGEKPCSDDSCVNRTLQTECCEETCPARLLCNNRRMQQLRFSKIQAFRVRGDGARRTGPDRGADA